MSEETPKMEKDYSAVVDVQLPEAQKLAKVGLDLDSNVVNWIIPLIPHLTTDALRYLK